MPTERIELVYKFEELSDKAKEKARDWYRSCIDSNDFDTVIEDATRMAAILGIEIETHGVKLMGGSTRQDPCVWWQLDGQGQGASFSGFYRYAKGSCKAIRSEASSDTELHRIADALFEAQKASGYQIETRITARGAGYWNMCFSDRDGSIADDRLDDVERALRDFAKWILKQLQTESDYLHSEENVDETIEANEYDFDVNGNRI